MSKQEETTPLKSQGTLPSTPPYTRTCHQLVPPREPLESECGDFESYVTPPPPYSSPYSPQPLEFEYRIPSPPSPKSPLYDSSPPPTSPLYGPLSPPPQPLSVELESPPNFSPDFTPYPDYYYPELPDGYSPPPVDMNSPYRFNEMTDMLAQIPLHCYNLHKGTNLQLWSMRNLYDTGLFSMNMLLVVKDPIANSLRNLDTAIWYINNTHGLINLTVMRCIIHPEEEEEEEEEKEEEERNENEKLVKDELFKGSELNWMHEDALTGTYKLQYHEMKESEVEQNKKWLHLYGQLALYSVGKAPRKTEPFELRKIVVRTKEDVEPKNKAKATNAIFYISIKSSRGQDYNAIVQRTATLPRRYMALVVQCFSCESPP